MSISSVFAAGCFEVLTRAFPKVFEKDPAEGTSAFLKSLSKNSNRILSSNMPQWSALNDKSSEELSLIKYNPKRFDCLLDDRNGELRLSFDVKNQVAQVVRAFPDSNEELYSSTVRFSDCDIVSPAEIGTGPLPKGLSTLEEKRETLKALGLNDEGIRNLNTLYTKVKASPKD